MTSRNARALLVLGGVGVGVVLLTNRAAGPVRKAGGSDNSGGLLPAPRPAPAPTPTPTPTPAPRPSPAPTPAPTHGALVDRVERAIYAEIPARRLSPVASRTLAVNLVGACERLGYPLDLAFGHVRAETDLQLLARNSSSGATGPLQVTRIAAQQVGEAWPIESPVTQLEVGLRYMLWLRRTFPECAVSVRESLRHYGMGRGNWLKYKAGQLGCSSTVSVVRAELGCTARPYSALAIGTARKHPELKTVAWWGVDP